MIEKQIHFFSNVLRTSSKMKVSFYSLTEGGERVTLIHFTVSSRYEKELAFLFVAFYIDFYHSCQKKVQTFWKFRIIPKFSEHIYSNLDNMLVTFFFASLFAADYGNNL